MNVPMILTRREAEQISTILKRRANEIASFRAELQRTKDVASVDYGLELEIERLRKLASKVCPGLDDEEEVT